MNDICLISKIIELGEILVMTRKQAECLNRLMNEGIAKEVMKFFKDFDNLPITDRALPYYKTLSEKRDMLYEVLYEKARTYTFHLEVEEKGLFEIIKRLNLETLFILFDNLSEIKEKLIWLMDNKQYWIESLDIRSKDDYEEFYSEMTQLHLEAVSIGESLGVKYCKDIDKAITRNAPYFYNHREKKKYTRMSRVISAGPLIEEIINGINYTEARDRDNIYLTISRQI